MVWDSDSQVAAAVKAGGGAVPTGGGRGQSGSRDGCGDNGGVMEKKARSGCDVEEGRVVQSPKARPVVR
jgi:hypothetical protein